MTGRSFTAYGGAAAFWRCRDRRILYEGPANAGKTRADLQWADWLLSTKHGIRALFCRQTLQSLRESIQVTLEQKVWTPDHPALTYGTSAKRSHRRIYEYPPQGGNYPSTIVLGGLEDPGWTYSMEYDIILVFEAWEVSLDSIERLYRANRNHILCRYADDFELQGHHAKATGCRTNRELKIACGHDFNDLRWMQHHRCWQQTIFDTNPADEFHPLNQMAPPLGLSEIARIKDGHNPSSRVFSHPDYPVTRILARHEDNPACTDEDLDNLRALTGHRRSRLYLGLWTSSEGLVFPEYDATRHSVTADVEREGVIIPGEEVDSRPLYLTVYPDEGKPYRVDITWTFASMDFGYNAPACLGVWGVDRQDRLWLLEEIYRSEKRDEWWAEQAEALYRQYGLRRLVADSEDSGRIVTLNDRLCRVKGRTATPIAIPVKKTVPKHKGFNRFKPGAISLMGEALGEDRLFFRRDSLRHGVDPLLKEKRAPVCTTQEIGGLVYPEAVDGRALKEVPAEGQADHGVDMTIYACVFAWQRDFAPHVKDEAYRLGTAGWRLQHDQVDTSGGDPYDVRDLQRMIEDEW